MPDILDGQNADLARYLALHAGLNDPLSHLDAQERRSQLDRLEGVLHMAAATLREATAADAPVA